MRQAAASAAVAANLFMVRTGTFIDERQIRYVNAMAECVPTGSDASTADKLLEYLKGEKCKHIVLVHRQLGPQSNGELVSEIRQFGNGSDSDPSAPQTFRDGDMLRVNCPVKSRRPSMQASTPSAMPSMLVLTTPEAKSKQLCNGRVQSSRAQILHCLQLECCHYHLSLMTKAMKICQLVRTLNGSTPKTATHGIRTTT
jgi:hypothetical protein